LALPKAEGFYFRNVDYAEARYVTKPRKAKPGLVVLLRSKSMMVYPRKPERQEKLEKE
jgi:hypothetical protein